MKYLGGWDIMPVDNSLGMEAFEQGIVDLQIKHNNLL